MARYKEYEEAITKQLKPGQTPKDFIIFLQGFYEIEVQEPKIAPLEEWPRNRVKATCAPMDSNADDLVKRFQDSHADATRLVEAYFAWEDEFAIFHLIEMEVPKSLGSQECRIVAHVTRIHEPDAEERASNTYKSSLYRHMSTEECKPSSLYLHNEILSRNVGEGLAWEAVVEEGRQEGTVDASSWKM